MLRPRTLFLCATRVPRRLRRPLSTEVTITFVDQQGAETPIKAEVGKSVLDAALAHDIDIEAAYVLSLFPRSRRSRCGGEMACSTCHVICEKEHYDTLGTPSEEEKDM